MFFLILTVGVPDHVGVVESHGDSKAEEHEDPVNLGDVDLAVDPA